MSGSDAGMLVVDDAPERTATRTEDSTSAAPGSD